MRWNRITLALIALSWTTAAFTPQSPVTGTVLARDTDSRWVPFDLTPGNQIRFEMSVAGKRANAILDTGVSTTVASRLFATRAALKLEPQRGEHANAIGGQVPLGWARADRLTMGGMTRSQSRLAIANLPAISAGGGADAVDLLIGSDTLACCAVDIDYTMRRFRLLPTGRMPFTGARVPLARQAGTGVFVSSATISGKTVRPLIVDTGDGAALTLSRDSWTAARIRPKSITTAVAFGLGGPIETEMAVLPDVRFGTLAPLAVETRIEARGGFSDLTGTAGRIGNGLFQRYRLLMDVGAGHLILGEAPQSARPIIRSTSGLLVGYDNGRLSVLHVMRGSPAAASGWQARDQICTVDGQPVPPPKGGSVDTGWSAGKPGRTVSFGMCDGTERTLTLRHFY